MGEGVFDAPSERSITEDRGIGGGCDAEALSALRVLGFVVELRYCGGINLMVGGLE